MSGSNNIESSRSPAADAEGGARMATDSIDFSMLAPRIPLVSDAATAVNEPFVDCRELATLAFEILTLSRRMEDADGLHGPFVIDLRMRNSIERACGILTMALAQVVRAPDATKSHMARDTALVFFNLVLPVFRKSVEEVHQWKNALPPDAPGSDEVQERYLKGMFGVLCVTTRVLGRALEWHAIAYQAPDAALRTLFALCMARFRAMDSKAALCHPLRDTVEQALVYCLHVQHLPTQAMPLVLIQDSLVRLRMHSANVALQSVLAPPVIGGRSDLPSSPGALGYVANETAIRTHLRSLLFPSRGGVLPHAAQHQSPRGGKVCFCPEQGPQLRVQIGPNACTPNVFENTLGAVNAKAVLGPGSIDARCETCTQWRWIHVPQQMTGLCFPQPQTPVCVCDPENSAASFGVIRYTHCEPSGGVYLGVEVYFTSVGPRLLRASKGGWPTHTHPTRLYLVASPAGMEGIVVISQTSTGKVLLQDMPLQILDVAKNRYFQRSAVVASWQRCIAVSYDVAPEAPRSECA